MKAAAKNPKPPTGPGLWNIEGPIAAACSKRSWSYEPRQEQQAVAGLIEAALSRQESQAVGILPIEAATGTGKTLAYLVPGALHASAGDTRMLVSTHTIALGTQIMRKDGPIASEVVQATSGRIPRLAHMRGRSSFMSPSRSNAIGNLLREDGLPSSAWQPYIELAAVARRAVGLASEALRDGDLSTALRAIVETCLLDRMEEQAGARLSRADVCLLASSPDDELAVHRLSRALAHNATILVTTHAYTASALARKALFGAEEDPFDILVIDEADQWAGAASSVSLMSLSLNDLARTIEAVLRSSRHAKDQKDIAASVKGALHALEIVRDMAPDPTADRRPIEQDNGTLKALSQLGSAIDRVLETAGGNRRHTAAAADDLSDRAETIARILRSVSGNETDFWIARWRFSRIQRLPSIDVQGRDPGRILKRLWAAADGHLPLARTVVLTSATLTTPGFGEQSRWKSIEIATGADPSSGMVLTDLATSIQPHDFGRLRVRFADPAGTHPTSRRTRRH